MKFWLAPSIMLSCIILSANAGNWTFDDCVQYARENNIDLRKARLSEQTAGYNLEEAKALWQPSLDFGTSHQFGNYPWNENSKNVYNSSYSLNAGWTVWDGGARPNTIKRRVIDSEISRISTDDMMRTLETDLLQVYLNILYARESVEVYNDAVKLSKAQAERAKALWETGKASKVDYAQLQAQYEQDKYALVDAQGQYDNRRMELKKLLELGIEQNFDIETVELTEAQVMQTLPPMDESYTMALDTDLLLKSLDLEKDGTAVDIAIAKAAGLPRITLSAGVGTGYAAPGVSFGNALKFNFGETAGISIAVPILDNKKTRMAVARAKVQQLDAELDIESRRTDLAQLVENWYIDTRSAQARYSAAEEQLKAAELTDELTNEQFALGLVNPIDLMSSHNNLIAARHSLLQAKYMAVLGLKMIEYYRTADISLK